MYRLSTPVLIDNRRNKKKISKQYWDDKSDLQYWISRSRVHVDFMPGQMCSIKILTNDELNNPIRLRPRSMQIGSHNISILSFRFIVFMLPYWMDRLLGLLHRWWLRYTRHWRNHSLRWARRWIHSTLSFEEWFAIKRTNVFQKWSSTFARWSVIFSLEKKLYYLNIIFSLYNRAKGIHVHVSEWNEKV